MGVVFKIGNKMIREELNTTKLRNYEKFRQQKKV